DEIHLDWRVVTFTGVVTLVTGVVVGLVPGLRASREDSADALREGGRTTGTRGAARRARRALVAAELALALITLSGTGMLVRSLWNLQRTELGFDPRNVLTASVALSAREYGDSRAAIFYQQLLNTLDAVPGVVSAGAAAWLPVVDAGGLWGVMPEGRPFAPGQTPSVVPQHITPGYLRAMGLTLYAGRDFSAGDGAASPAVVIVSKRLADLFWPNENALGKRMRVG